VHAGACSASKSDYLDTFGLSTGTRSLYITMSTGNEGELLCNNHASLYDMTGQACNDATRLCDATVQCGAHS
jgi:hypothetical protein